MEPRLNRSHLPGGESGLPPDDLLPDTPGGGDDERREIGRALEDAGFVPSMQDDGLFRYYYKKVSDGPGKEWPPYRRARFALQTMSREGCIELPVKPCQSGPAPAPVKEEQAPEPQPVSRPVVSDDDGFIDGYRILTPEERKSNLYITLGIMGLVVLAAVGVYFSIRAGRPAVGMGVGAGAATVGMGVAARLGRLWHARFTRPYLLIRLIVCLAMLFSKLAWNAAESAYGQLTELFGDVVSNSAFGLTTSVIWLAISIGAHLKLNITLSPSAGKVLGWVEALALTMSLGAFFFAAAGK